MLKTINAEVKEGVKIKHQMDKTTERTNWHGDLKALKCDIKCMWVKLQREETDQIFPDWIKTKSYHMLSIGNTQETQEYKRVK